MDRGQELQELWVERELLDGGLLGVDGVCVVDKGGLAGGLKGHKFWGRLLECAMRPSTTLPFIMHQTKPPLPQPSNALLSPLPNKYPTFAAQTTCWDGRHAGRPFQRYDSRRSGRSLGAQPVKTGSFFKPSSILG